LTATCFNCTRIFIYTNWNFKINQWWSCLDTIVWFLQVFLSEENNICDVYKMISLNAAYNIVWYSEYSFLLMHVCFYTEFIAEKRMSLTMLRVHALFHHIIFFIFKTLRRWKNENMYYYRAIKYLYCSLKPYFRGQSDSSVTHKFFMKNIVRLAFIARLKCQFCMYLQYKMMAYRWPLVWRLICFYNLEKKRNFIKDFY